MDKQFAGIERQSRREFCMLTCETARLLLLGAAFAPLLNACKDDSVSASAPGLPTLQATVSNNTVTLTVDATSPLAAVGSAALVQYSGGALLVAHTSTDTFIALTAICTHQGCTITGYQNGQYVCPCHGSRYTTNGQVVQGPAQIPLRSYPTQFANNQLVISLQ
ncbi:MAG TPA: ubiquinol-cytochrome c reductase iron-sulfur subunit [Bacteroidota bacterium]|nr:ubiquinol-cytochrome c reductase iron-sulfur subunit [Bacteroidota bacterium]